MDEEILYCDNMDCGRRITEDNPVVAEVRFVWGALIFCKSCEGED